MAFVSLIRFLIVFFSDLGWFFLFLLEGDMVSSLFHCTHLRFLTTLKLNHASTAPAITSLVL